MFAMRIAAFTSVGVLTAVALWVTLGGASSRPSTVPHVRNALPERVSDPVPAEPVENPERLVMAPPRTSKNRGEWIGLEVLDKAGVPVDGAHVDVFLPDSEVRITQGTTNSKGIGEGFSVSDSVEFADIVVTKMGFELGIAVRVTVAESVLRPVRIILDRAKSIRGFVRDSRGIGLEGLTVCALDVGARYPNSVDVARLRALTSRGPSCVSDAHGSFEIRSCGVDRHYLIAAGGNGYAVMADAVVDPRQPDSEVLLVASRVIGAFVTVVDDERRPVPVFSIGTALGTVQWVWARSELVPIQRLTPSLVLLGCGDRWNSRDGCGRVFLASCDSDTASESQIRLEVDVPGFRRESFDIPASIIQRDVSYFEIVLEGESDCVGGVECSFIDDPQASSEGGTQIIGEVRLRNELGELFRVPVSGSARELKRIWPLPCDDYEVQFIGTDSGWTWPSGSWAKTRVGSEQWAKIEVPLSRCGAIEVLVQGTPGVPVGLAARRLLFLSDERLGFASRFPGKFAYRRVVGAEVGVVRFGPLSAGTYFVVMHDGLAGRFGAVRSVTVGEGELVRVEYAVQDS